MHWVNNRNDARQKDIQNKYIAISIVKNYCCWKCATQVCIWMTCYIEMSMLLDTSWHKCFQNMVSLHIGSVITTVTIWYEVFCYYLNTMLTPKVNIHIVCYSISWLGNKSNTAKEINQTNTSSLHPIYH